MADIDLDTTACGLPLVLGGTWWSSVELRGALSDVGLWSKWTLQATGYTIHDPTLIKEDISFIVLPLNSQSYSRSRSSFSLLIQHIVLWCRIFGTAGDAIRK